MIKNKVGQSLLTLQMMDETSQTLKSTAVGWSAAAVNFVEATSSTNPDQLSGVSYPNL
jgi:hypothetical protein